MTMQMPRSITMYTDKPLYLDNLHDRCSEVKEKNECKCVCGDGKCGDAYQYPHCTFYFCLLGLKMLKSSSLRKHLPNKP